MTAFASQVSRNSPAFDSNRQAMLAQIDALRALDTGVDGLDIVIGTSPQLMQHSHGRDIRPKISYKIKEKAQGSEHGRSSPASQ